MRPKTSHSWWLTSDPLGKPANSSFKIYLEWTPPPCLHHLSPGLLDSWLLFFFFFFNFFLFLGPHLQHMEVPKPGSNGSYSCWPMPQPQPLQIQAMSETYTTAHGNNAGPLTEWGQGLNLHPHDSQSDLFLLSHNMNSDSWLLSPTFDSLPPPHPVLKTANGAGQSVKRSISTSFLCSKPCNGSLLYSVFYSKSRQWPMKPYKSKLLGPHFLHRPS